MDIVPAYDVIPTGDTSLLLEVTFLLTNVCLANNENDFIAWENFIRSILGRSFEISTSNFVIDKGL